jgi:two-component system CheB/CheR fusion protein
MKARVFVRRAASTSLGEALTPAARWSSVISVPHPPAHDRGTPVGELHHRVVEKYAPPSVLVNHELDIVHVSEHAGKYLAVAGGEPTRQLLRLIHPALRLDLRTALYTARTSGNETRVVRFDDGGPRAVELRVRSVSHPELGGGSLLVMFDELAPDAHPAQGVGNAAIEPVVREMEEELHRTRDQLRTTIEQYETSVEELKASNEELQAINEELRSATEELETSKEELQSVNEELTTLNHELKVKIDEISHANSDLQNLIGSTDIGVVFLDRQLRIKRFTPRVQDLFNVIASDIGRPLSDLTNRLDSADLNQMARSVLDTLRIAEQRVTSRDHHRYYVRALPYRSIDDHIDGVVLTFVDVSDLRDAIDARDRSEAALEKVEERLRVTLLAAPIAILSYDARLELVWAYVAGRELEVRPGTPPSMFSAASTERLATCVRQASMRRHRDQVELEVLLDGQPHLFDFRIEPTTAGVTVVGFDLHHDRR